MTNQDANMPPANAPVAAKPAPKTVARPTSWTGWNG